MSQETRQYLISDVEALAEHVLTNWYDYDRSGSRTYDGLRYCVACGAYEYADGSGIEHKSNCVTQIAQDVLTGSLKEGGGDE